MTVIICLRIILNALAIGAIGVGVLVLNSKSCIFSSKSVRIFKLLFYFTCNGFVGDAPVFKQICKHYLPK